MKARGTVHKYGDDVDTDVIIPARYLNTADMQELAKHCMEDIDIDFAGRVKAGDIGSSAGCMRPFSMGAPPRRLQLL